MKQPAKVVPASMSAPANWSSPSCVRDTFKPLHTVPNTPAGHRQLLGLLTRHGAHARVVLEATGVYSLRLALALHRAERVEVMVINPRASKDFQRARLTRAKTGRVGARGLLEYLARMDFVAWTPPTDAVLALQQLARRMVQLRGELTREQTRLHAIAFAPDRDGLIAADLKANIHHLQTPIRALSQSAAALAAREPDLARHVERLCSVPGIGKVSALRPLGELLVLPAMTELVALANEFSDEPPPSESNESRRNESECMTPMKTQNISDPATLAATAVELLRLGADYGGVFSAMAFDTACAGPLLNPSRAETRQMPH